MTKKNDSPEIYAICIVSVRLYQVDIAHIPLAIFWAHSPLKIDQLSHY